MELVMENNNSSETILRELVRERVQKMYRFYIHLFIYIIGLTIYISKTYFGAQFNFFPFRLINETVMWIWTSVLVIKGIRLFVNEKVLGANWEQNKINEILENENKTSKKWN